jgi:hypothetical protein
MPGLDEAAAERLFPTATVGSHDADYTAVERLSVRYEGDEAAVGRPDRIAAVAD